MNRITTYVLLTIFCIALVFGFTRPFIGNPNKYNLNYYDWRLHLSWAGSARNTLLQYGQLPLWNPYRCGGVPVVSEPESDIFSPYLPFLIVFGPLLGYFAFFLTNFFVGFIGFYKLGKQYGLSTLASVLVGQSYMMSGLYILPFFVGMTNFISLGYLPFVVLYFEKYLDEGVIKHAVLAAFFTSLMFLSGFHYIPIVLLYLLLSTIIRSLQSKNIHELGKFIWVASLFSGFSALKLFGSIDLLLRHGPIAHNYERVGGYSLSSLWYSLVSRNQTQSMLQSLTTSNSNFWTGINYQLDENSMYIGIVLFALFVYGYIKRQQKFSRLIYVLIIFAIISFGTNIYPSIYSALKTLPIISSIRVANRFRYMFMVPFVLIIGYGFDIFMRHAIGALKLKPKVATVVFSIFLFVVGVDLLYVNLNRENILPILHSMQIISPNTSSVFYNRCTTELSEYEVVMHNQGNILCFDNVLFSAHAICKESKIYKGNAYFSHEGNSANVTYISPSEIRIDAHARSWDTLVVNQNYYRNWNATVDGVRVNVLNRDNLLSVPVSKGDHAVRLYYVDQWFIFGFGISLLTFFFCGIYLWRLRK